MTPEERRLLAIERLEPLYEAIERAITILADTLGVDIAAEVMCPVHNSAFAVDDALRTAGEVEDLLVSQGFDLDEFHSRVEGLLAKFEADRKA